jgi:hypothetical protein
LRGRTEPKRDFDRTSNSRGSPLRQRRKTQVPEQYWGYSLQPIRFLHLLIDSPPSANVSLEVFEDVGRDAAEGMQLASQTKTGLVKNPISDRAADFWKTLANWFEAVSAGVLDVSTTSFEIYLARKHRGAIAESFHAAETDDAAKSAVDAARSKLWGAAPSYPLRGSLAKELRSYTDLVLDPEQRVLAKIVRRLQLSFASRDPLADLRPLVANKWVRPESVDLVIRYAHGWVKERIDALIQERRPAVINVDDFNREIAAYLPRIDFRQILESFAGNPSPEEIDAEMVRTYVRQLQLIELPEEETIEAINDCLRASVTRTMWAEEGIVHERSLDDFSEGLIAYWKNRKRYNSLAHSNLSSIQHGQMLLCDCCMQTRKLQGLEVPSFFTPGSYHILADERDVGWHPDYLKKLSERH